MALLFDANLLDMSDWTSVVESGTGSIAPDTVFNQEGAAALKIVEAAGISYLEKVLDAAESQLLVRIALESHAGLSLSTTGTYIQFLTAGDTVVFQA